MRRLFTFGCSFTKYGWPTWADLLGETYWNLNWGNPGVGNRAIAERIVEAHTNFKFTKDDIIIVQWSSYIRHDYARPDIEDSRTNMWKTKGNIFSKWNKKVFDDKWIKTFWNEQAYLLHTLHHIMLTQGFLESIGCTWYMTSITDIEELRMCDTNENDPPTNVANLWEFDPSLMPYRECIWLEKEEHWLPPLLPEKWNTPELDWWFDIDYKDKVARQIFVSKEVKFKEPHLTTLQHHNYLKNNGIYNLFGISDDSKTPMIIESIKERAGTNQDKFLELLHEEIDSGTILGR